MGPATVDNEPMREVVFATPNRQLIDTGHREFDRTIGALGTGNLIDSNCRSSYIRSFHTSTNPGGAFVAPGAMQEFDLASFDDLPADVRAYVSEEAAFSEQAILYEIRHYSGKRDQWGEYAKTVHGYIVTRDHEHDYTLLRKFYCGPTRKSVRVVDVCAEYISNDPNRPEEGAPISSRPRGRLSLLAERGLAGALA